MAKIRGFKLGKRLVKVFRRVYRRRQYRRLTSLLEYKPQRPKPVTVSKLSNWCNWAGLIKSKAKRLCSTKPRSGYMLVNHEPEKPEAVPKGHLAVYVGQRNGDGEFSRVLVPVIYFNHPLFGQLLREAEEEYGYEHQGGITIPCQISEFHKVQTTIENGRSCRRLMTWHKHHGF